MIPIKSPKEIEIMREGGQRLSWVVGKVINEARPGVALFQLDQLAELLIEKQGGKPSFKMVPGYNWATCLNVNEGVVHGIPGNYRLQEGDLFSIDVGMFYKGFHTDMARTLCIQAQNSKVKTQNDFFLEVGRRTLKKAIQIAKVGNRVGHISKTIGNEVKKAGFTPIRVLTGHGVGRELHEKPQIPCFLKGKIEQTSLLKPGMVLAIEVIYSQGGADVVMTNDGWTIQTADGKLAGLFEDTVAITSKGPLILTSID